MNQKELKQLLETYKAGEISEDDVLLKLKEAPYEDLGFAKLDRHRALRQGQAEVIYGAGKTGEQIRLLAERAWQDRQKTILVTRMNQEKKDLIAASNPPYEIHYNEFAEAAVFGEIPEPDGLGKIVVATGGTSDQKAAEEAVLTCEAFGNETVRLYDVGIAGLHRLLSNLDILMSANAVIALAGMEGALASVIGGLVDCPVIAVPTSVGYGASFHGLSALLSMLNSCASGVSVVNIDNGFGAAYQASMINHPKYLGGNQ
ncbi:MAG: nickel pincer cofactor biosynthesis protein LarB [Stecheria intestinalis]|uniref:nickel pincer cofactor biosynthesis protein LarB n=1 Tax=Stecheria intestinalis TaxID=2606630 RepID=UPI0023F057C6|nr:nickel pincer cofactor biosynthesis protein LarB [Stecheria intestinalis]MDD5880498.1 nickel pincer cofactor biosynthesis protein LarB [Stecheria intestinalis]MDD6365577.1 nickel pincer cofactor biosynthesis protein LarB [Stecheria intestinalis]